MVGAEVGLLLILLAIYALSVLYRIALINFIYKMIIQGQKAAVQQEEAVGLLLNLTAMVSLFQCKHIFFVRTFVSLQNDNSIF